MRKFKINGSFFPDDEPEEWYTLAHYEEQIRSDIAREYPDAVILDITDMGEASEDELEEHREMFKNYTSHL